ncbi:MAG: hypothetical protein ABSE54_05110 [Smithella sp.]|jgi:hypothetical protein
MLWDNIPIWHPMKWPIRKPAYHKRLSGCRYLYISIVQYIKIHQSGKTLASIEEAYTRIYPDINVDEMVKMVISMFD